jgi:hypothetical protein
MSTAKMIAVTAHDGVAESKVETLEQWVLTQELGNYQFHGMVATGSGDGRVSCTNAVIRQQSYKCKILQPRLW